MTTPSRPPTSPKSRTSRTHSLQTSYEDFRNVIREDELEDEHFCMIKDSLLFDEDRKNFGQVCFIC